MTHLKARVEDLTPFHYGQIMRRAEEWRSRNRPLVFRATQDKHPPAPPMGSNIFDPAKWDGGNWLWFYTVSAENMMRNYG